MLHRVPRAVRVCLTVIVLICSTGYVAVGAESSLDGFSTTSSLANLPKYASRSQASKVSTHSDDVEGSLEPSTEDVEASAESVEDSGVGCCHTGCGTGSYGPAGALRNLAARLKAGQGVALGCGVCGRCGATPALGCLRNSIQRGLGSRTTDDDVALRQPDKKSPELFYNYYHGANAGARVGTSMYPSPHPTPPITGQTYYTYQPFLPHEHMYMHNRSYYRMYNFNQGLNRTHISYQPNSRTSLRQWFHWMFEPAR